MEWMNEVEWMNGMQRVRWMKQRTNREWTMNEWNGLCSFKDRIGKPTQPVAATNTDTSLERYGMEMFIYGSDWTPDPTRIRH